MNEKWNDDLKMLRIEMSSFSLKVVVNSRFEGGRLHVWIIWYYNMWNKVIRQWKILRIIGGSFHQGKWYHVMRDIWCFLFALFCVTLRLNGRARKFCNSVANSCNTSYVSFALVLLNCVKIIIFYFINNAVSVILTN